ncbi:MAG: hypothetical protein WAV90_15825 [Gordonia amarae]
MATGTAIRRFRKIFLNREIALKHPISRVNFSGFLGGRFGMRKQKSPNRDFDFTIGAFLGLIICGVPDPNRSGLASFSMWVGTGPAADIREGA